MISNDYIDEELEKQDMAGRLWVEFRSALRGRLPFAITLGTLLAAGAAAGMWHTAVPLYRSQALIRVNSYTAKVLYGTESTGTLPRYENYLGAQVQVIKSHRVTDMAMQSGVWTGLGRALTPETKRNFRNSLQVGQQSQSEIIMIGFTDREPLAAERATEAMVDAYLRVHTEAERVGDIGRQRILEDRRSNLTEQLGQVRAEMESSASSYGLAGIESQYGARIQTKTQIELELNRLVQDRESLAKMIENRPEVEDLAGGSAEERSLEAAILQIEMAIDLRKRSGMLDKNLWMKGKRNERAFLAERLEGVRASRVAAADEAKDSSSGGGVDQELLAVDLRIAARQREVAALQPEIEDLKAVFEKLTRLRETEENLRTRIAETASRIEALNLEAAQDNRISVLSKSDVSFTPTNAGTIAARTGMAGAGGMTLGVALVGLLGMRRREVRDSRDVQTSLKHREILGGIPELDPTSTTHGQNTAMLSVDHLRTLVHLRASRDGQPLAIAVTGPVSGSGKTTTAMLLARSFADAKTKTLLIDLDAEGQGMSRLVERCCLPRLGEAVVRRFGISRRLITGLLNDGSSLTLGEKLVEHGVITPEQRDEALEVIKAAPRGLEAVLGGEDMMSAVFPTRWKRLDALTIRHDAGRGFRRLGRQTVAQIIATAKENYDLVVIDTGPTPGSVEGAFAVSAADHTLVVVAKGDQRVELEACDGFLRSIDAKVMGLIMNRCDIDDLKLSNISMQRRSVPVPVDGGPVRPIDDFLALDDRRRPLPVEQTDA